jgi:hypothetical protein
MDPSPRQAELALLASTDDPELVRRALESHIAKSARQEVRLRLTDNSHTMLSTRFVDGVRTLRLHRMFVDAPPAIIDAVGLYIARGDRTAGALIDAYVEDNQHAIARKPKRPTPLDPRGVVYELDAIQRALSDEYFEGSVSIPIGWGRAGSARGRRGRRTIRMGVYLIDERAIRIHPVLDQHWVPKYFVEWVVFHEMVHHVVGFVSASASEPERAATAADSSASTSAKSARRDLHSTAFRERERAFREYERAQQWEQANLPRLIASRARDRDERSDRARHAPTATHIAADARRR